ncbi:transcriptional regulator [Sphingobacterium alkalisoli]|uniref:Transcriptional regulator n=1 Tax=Sphingobacterium alkalisoli TaxID=1874115 RepID=A0A4V5LYA8_9SPHI|nr:triple tyrosine motif-containing protein [Sphingobacterium alkalisoli]TJY65879.1 transcriptional regulator [Sphingobacterium alkalisoli]GGH17696.1 hypothetical protein GCM10011418_20860 [Sphingobacterium alkalisoli]
MIRFLLFYCFIFFFQPLFAQHIIRSGTPYVKQFTKKVYKAGNQNWGIAISPEGIIYTANTEGLLSFDGQFWNLYPLKNKSIVRSVSVDSEGKVYTGGKGEFGFWERKKYGGMRYTSISGLVEKADIQNDEIWKIIIADDKIYFHSFSKCYVYQDNHIKTITASGEPFLFPHLANGDMYFEQIPSGLHKLVTEKLVPIKDKSILGQKNILCMLPFGPAEVLIGTATDGLFIMDKDGNITPWKTAIDHDLKRAQLNNGIEVYGGHYAFGTIQNGVFIINKRGDLIQHINKHNGLQNNTVLSIAKDKQENIWVGLDNGIDRIEINSPVYYYADFSGNIGTVYTSAIYNGKIYLGTNQGLFVSPWKGPNDYNSFDFKLIPNSNGQVWTLSIVGNELICGHNNGTFKVENDNLIQISTVTGGWIFSSIEGTNFMLQGNYTGVALFDSDPTTFLRQFDEIKAPIRYISQKSGTEFWIGNENEIKLVQFYNGFRNLKTLNSVGRTPNNNLRYHGIFKLENNLVFATDSGFYVYDGIVKKFKPHNDINEKLGSFRFSNKIIPIHSNRYWFVKKSHIARVEVTPSGDVVIDSTALTSLSDKMMNYYESIIPITNQTFLIGLDNGFAIYDSQSETKIEIKKPIISHIWNISSGIHPIDDEKLSILNRENNIRIAYASPWYASSPVQYQYFLEGYSEKWSDWEETSYRDFTNLNFGSYTFQVRARSVAGAISNITEVSFEIQPPWYLSWKAIAFYIISLGAIVYYGRKWNNKRIQKRQFQINRRLLAQQKAVIARDAELNEQKLVKLKNQQLQNELDIKNRELANSAMNIVYKNEMLNNLHDELRKLKDSEGRYLNPDQLRRINKLIDDAHNDDRDWNLFEKSFDEAHGNFFKKLKAEYPELIPNDLKLCAYLRLNMSSKEIASLLNITTRGVEIRRYRLRKKLNIPTEKNLSEFLLER